MPELLGKRDVIEDCRNQVRELVGNIGSVHVTAELQLPNGDRRIYRAKSVDKNSAIREILTFVAAVEKATGQSVLWRLKGEKTYHFGANYSSKKSFIKRLSDTVANFFFDLND